MFELHICGGDRIRLVAYAHLLLPQRRVLHRQVGEALELFHADNLEPHQLAIGLHYREAELWERAFTSFRQAGTAATTRSAYREAAVCFELALGALGYLHERPDRLAQAIDVRLQLRLVLHALGEIKRMGDELEAALILAESGHDDARMARVLEHLSHHFWVTGRPRDSLAAGERAVHLARAAGEGDIELQARFDVALAYNTLGDLQRAIELLRSVLESLRNPSIDQLASLRVYTRTWLAASLASCGEFVDAVAHGQEAIRVAEVLGDGWYLSHAYLSLGFPSLRQGKLPDAARRAAMTRGFG